MQHLQLPLLAGGNNLLDPPVMGGDLYNIKVKRGWWLSMPVEISKCTLIQQVLLPILTVKVLLLHQKDPCTDCTSPFTLAISNLDPLLPHVNTGVSVFNWYQWAQSHPYILYSVHCMYSTSPPPAIHTKSSHITVGTVPLYSLFIQRQMFILQPSNFY